MPTEAELLESLLAKLQTDAPDVEVRKGPIRDLFAVPVAREEALLLNQILRVRRLYSVDFSDTMTREELESLAYQYGVTPFVGSRARGTVTIFVTSQPVAGGSLLVPSGTTFSTEDGVYQYVATEDTEVTQQQLGQYFSSVSRSYQIDIPVEAIEVGDSYNVAAFRVVRVVTNLTFNIQKIANQAELGGGKSAESAEELADRIRDVSIQNERGTLAGFKRQIFSVSPGYVLDVNLVRNIDTIGLVDTYRAMLDAFVIGTKAVQFTETFEVIVAENNQSYSLSKSPVLTVSEVRVGTTVLTTQQWSLVKNNVRSDSDKDSLIIHTLNSLGTQITVTYTYNGLLEDLKSFFTTDSTDVFGVVLRFREAISVPLRCNIMIRVQTSDSTVAFVSQIRSKTLEFINTNKFRLQITAAELREYLRLNVPGLLAVSVTAFGRVSSQTSIDLISFQPYEYATVGIENVSVFT